MDPTILQFMIGVLTGTGAGLVTVQRLGAKAKIRSKTSYNRSKTTPAAARGRTTTKIARTRGPRRPVVKPRDNGEEPAPNSTVESPLIMATKPDATISACPGCGLEAPEALMAEHFQGSPSHQNGKLRERPLIQEDSMPKVAATTIDLDEDSQRSFRRLLQMLVPPRAFGHRHQQRTVNPLSQLVQTIDVSKIPRPGP